jgi:hypothetical protein
LDFRAAELGEDFSLLSPSIGQTFFIGDGLTETGNGTVQQFVVPAAATRLFLGFADGGSFSGQPNRYGDKSGSLVATFSIKPVPEIGTLWATVAGLGFLLKCRRARKSQSCSISRSSSPPQPSS